MHRCAHGKEETTIRGISIKTDRQPSQINPCIDGARAVSPPPAGLICQQRGTLTTVGSDDREFPAPHPENSINGCGAYCLDHWDCEVSEYNSADGLCTYYFNSAADEGFVADPASAFIYSDMNCFESC